MPIRSCFAMLCRSLVEYDPCGQVSACRTCNATDSQTFYIGTEGKAVLVARERRCVCLALTKRRSRQPDQPALPHRSSSYTNVVQDGTTLVELVLCAGNEGLRR